MQSTQHWQAEDLAILSMWRTRLPIPFWDLLVDALMWPSSIEVLDIGMKDAVKLLLLQDEQMTETISPHTAQKPFTDRIGLGSVIWGLEQLDATACGHARQTRSKLVITIADEILRPLPKGSRFPQLLCSPGVGRRASDTHMDDFTRVEINDEESEQ